MAPGGFPRADTVAQVFTHAAKRLDPANPPKLNPSELLDQRKFHAQVEARMAIFEFIEGWCNPHRRHSALGYLSPRELEQKGGARSAA